LVHLTMGNVVLAEKTYRRVAKTTEATLGADSLVLATVRNNLAEALVEQGRNEEAEVFQRLVLATRREALGERHPDYAQALSKLAQTRFWQGDAVEAEELIQQAYEVLSEAYGAEHPEVARVESDLGAIAFQRGDVGRGEQRLRAASTSFLRTMQDTFSVQSERQKLVMLQRSRFNLDAWLSAALFTDVDAANVYDQVLRWKGVVFADQLWQRALLTEVDLEDEFEELAAVTRRLAAASLMTPGSAEQKTQRLTDIADLTEQKESLERKLASRSVRFRAQREASQVASSTLTTTLPQDAVLIDFLAFSRFDYGDLSPIGDGAPRHLMAFVARPGVEVAAVDLGPSEPIAELVEDWRRKRRYPIGLLGESHPGFELKRRLWEPLEPHLADAKVALISPDGPICRLPLAALPGSREGTFLIEEMAVAVAPAPQQIPKLLADDHRDNAAAT
ncbi:MAG: tetratricopeptide repeat protein, partial [Planctomycetota bacterium]